MLPKDNIVFDVNHIHNIFMIMLSQVLQNFKLNTSLIVVFFLILYNLDCTFFLFLMVDTAKRCAKRTLSEKLDDLIPIANVIANDHFIVTLVIIEPIVINKLIAIFSFLLFCSFTAATFSFCRFRLFLLTSTLRFTFLILLLIHFLVPRLTQKVNHFIV